MRVAAFLILTISFLSACGAVRKPPEATYNQKMLEVQEERLARGEDPYPGARETVSGDPLNSSLWARSVGSPYIIKNQKAQKVGDLLTILVQEEATATTQAKTETKKDASQSVGASLGWGSGSSDQKGILSGSATSSNSHKGEGTTDRSGTLKTTVQAVVENVLPNGTLFIRGTRLITINEEDQVVEITGFVRSDDIRINNTVVSSVLADARIRYIGAGVIADKQRVGWGIRLIDWVWPF